jgi:hypothetical protein
MNKPLLEINVRKSRYTHLGAICMAFAIIAIVALLVLTFSEGGPPKGFHIIAPYLWGSAGGFSALAVYVFWKSRKKLRIAQDAQGNHVMTIDGVPFLHFPVSYHCFQLKTHIKRIPNWEVYLTLWDDSGHALSLHTTRGAIHGEQPNWPEHKDPAPPCQHNILLDTGVNAITQVRKQVDTINDS